jgi:glucosyl-3-phosphoglycerate synthase
MSAVGTSGLRSFDHRSFSPAGLADVKDGRTISVCVPARDEAPTVGSIVDTIRTELMDVVELVDELLVIDDHSTDRTADVALAAGAKVVEASALLPEFGEGCGRGDARWKSV